MNEAMQWGIDQEPLALEAYVMATGNKVIEVGFLDHPTIHMFGASPDGLVGEDGCLEIKCPTTATHIETLLMDEIPEKHHYQMLGQIACSRRKWCDFMSFDPRLPDDMQRFIKRYEPDEKEIKHVENEVETFLHEVAATVEQLEKKFRS
jgi:hypothetical protein